MRDLLLADLFAGVYVAGDRLPNEDELGARFEVSRATIREAVRGLVEAGYLVRRHGTGTFVTALPRHRHTLNANLSYTADDPPGGFEPGRKLLRRLVRAASSDEVSALALAPADTVLFVERIRTADGRPVVYSTDRIPTALLGEAVAGVADGSLYELLETAHAGVRSASGEAAPGGRRHAPRPPARGARRRPVAAHRAGRLRRAGPARDALVGVARARRLRAERESHE